MRTFTPKTARIFAQFLDAKELRAGKALNGKMR